MARTRRGFRNYPDRAIAVVRYLDAGPFREICRRAGIAYSTRERKGLRFHDLRHSAATILLAAGVPERMDRVMGHR